MHVHMHANTCILARLHTCMTGTQGEGPLTAKAEAVAGAVATAAAAPGDELIREPALAPEVPHANVPFLPSIGAIIYPGCAHICLTCA